MISSNFEQKLPVFETDINKEIISKSCFMSTPATEVLAFLSIYGLLVLDTLNKAFL